MNKAATKVLKLMGEKDVAPVMSQSTGQIKDLSQDILMSESNPVPLKSRDFQKSAARAFEAPRGSAPVPFAA